jgi:GNAT superfamily N-acetyltransferase
MVHSGYQNRGIGAQLLEALEHRLAEATVFELLTGGRSQKNLSFYGARGYRVVAQEGILVTMRKVAYAK